MAQKTLEYPFYFRILRTLFPVFQKVAPKLATDVAVKLFLKPIPFPTKAEEVAARNTFGSRTITVKGKQVFVYEKGEGREVICLHGWSGRAMQFRFIADRIVKAGYKCVLIDAPAHGQSEGGTTNVFEFAEAYEQVQNACKHPLAAIGHSLGAASIAFASTKGLQPPALATLGAPVIAQDILDEFVKRINADPSIQEGIRARAISTYNLTFEQATMEETFKSITCPVIGFHGREDLDVPDSHLDALARIRPDMKVRKIPGIGHRRILKDVRVLDELVDWLKDLE